MRGFLVIVIITIIIVVVLLRTFSANIDGKS